MRIDLPKLEVGDNVEISIKWFDRINKSKFKLNTFKGIITSIERVNSLSSAFTVIKEAQKVIIKKKFFYNSPLLAGIKKIGSLKKVRRSKLGYYERALSDKKSRS